MERPQLLAPVFVAVDAHRDASLHIAACDQNGLITAFERLRAVPPEASMVKPRAGLPQLYKVGSAGCYALSLSTSGVIHEDGWAPFCKTVLTEAGASLLRENPFIGLSISQHIFDEHNELLFAVGALICLKDFDPDLMLSWKNGRHFSPDVLDHLDRVLPKIISGEVCQLGEAPTPHLPRHQRIGVFSNVDLTFPLGTYVFEGQVFSFEALPVQNVQRDQFRDFGMVVARFYNFLDDRASPHGAGAHAEPIFVGTVNAALSGDTIKQFRRQGVEHLLVENDANQFRSLAAILRDTGF